jgi:hypothetical protein
MLKVIFRRNFNLNPTVTIRIASTLFENFGARALTFLKRYPPQRNPNTRYVRGFGYPPNRRVSEDLGVRWNKQLIVKRRQISLIIGNNASYAQFVQSRQLQAEIHQNWWNTEEDMIESLYPQLQDEFAEFLPVYILSGNSRGR